MVYLKNRELLKTFLLFLFIFSLLPTIVSAQLFGTGIDPLKVVFGPDVPADWYEPYKVMQYLVFPFLAIWMIIFGILEEINIFRRHMGLHAIVALLMALMASVTGSLLYTVRWLLGLGAWWGTLMFVAVFFVGVWFWGVGRMKEFRNLEKQIIGKEKEIINLETEEGRILAMIQTYRTMEARGELTEEGRKDLIKLLNEYNKRQEEKLKKQQEMQKMAHRGAQSATQPGDPTVLGRG